MKRLFLILAVVALFSAASYAAPVCGGAQNVLAAGFSCEFGGLLFSNFSAVAASPGLVPSMTLVSAAMVGSDATLNFNPSLAVSNGATADLWFYFQVDGGVNAVDLSTGGTFSSITERACLTAIDPNAGNNCVGGIGNQLAALTITSGNSGRASFPTTAYVTPVYLFKNILVQAPANGSAELSAFSQSFAIPEPMTMVLFGSGLLALGLVRRFRR